MAVLSKIFIVGFGALAAAAPLNIPREYTSVVTEIDYTTVDVPVTLWVDESGHPIKTEAPAVGGQFAQQTPSSPFPTTTTVIPSSPTPPAVVPTTTAVAAMNQAPDTTPAYVAPTTPAYTPPAQVPAPSSTPPAAASPAGNSNSGSTGQSSGSVTASSAGTCLSTSDACSGDITHYDGGLGACGWDVNTASDFAIALPYEFMGTQSNGNPYCGKSVTIRNPTTGATAQATVGDKCMGCTGRSIDLTDALFNSIGGGCDGRCSGFEWWFN